MSCCCLPAVQRAPPAESQGKRVSLDIGGHRFVTARVTLSSGEAAGSELARLINGPCEPDGAYFLDEDGALFHYILNYLRHGASSFTPPESDSDLEMLAAQAQRLGLTALRDFLRDLKGAAPAGVANGVAPGNGGRREHVGAPLPTNEVQRINKLRSLCVLDTSNQGTEFDSITSAVAAILDVPIVLVSLVDSHRQWFKSKHGLTADETSRSSSFCAFTLLPEGLGDAAMLVVQDAQKDTRFMLNPLVTGEPKIRFYAGCPLITSEGLRLGSLCAIDRRPRDIRPIEAGMMINFAHLTTQALERKHLGNLEEVEDEDEADLEMTDVNFLGGTLRSQAMRDATRYAVVLVWATATSMEWPLLYANEVWATLTGEKVNCAGVFQKNQKAFWSYCRLLPSDGASGQVSSESRGASQQIMDLWNAVQQMMNGTVTDVRYGGLAFTALVKSPAGKRVMNCRLTPAELPISESAGAVQATGLEDAPRTWPKPPGFEAGHWCFIQLIEKVGASSSEVMSPPSLDESLEMRTSSKASFARAKKLSCSLIESGASTSMRLMNIRDGKGLSTKPPRAPFEDVRLVRLVGSGSFGSVYFSLWSGASVAVKVIKDVEGSINHQNADFEAALSASVSHPNLVQTFKHGGRLSAPAQGEDDVVIPGCYETWIVQEWCDGGTLRQYLVSPKFEGKAPPESESIEILLQISRAGAYLHDIGIIHGDLTANNVLLKSMPTTKGYVCKVCDFGLARVLEDSQEEIMTNTFGTVSHMPPELFQIGPDKQRLTPKADVFALGMLLYQLVTVKDPFANLSAPQIVIQISRGKLPTLPAEVSTHMASLYAKCTNKAPEDRPSFGEIVQSVLVFCRGDNVAEAPSDDPYRRCITDPSHAHRFNKVL
eukprot:TRINITY_DN1615_c0_g1_i3.p1 TRINITY_DN1615_c0_g1~~TRINITY_DN1615_c0_g1_i3.p1  ORF type:complete len:883 (-),score=131.88 TRINITY_DN1615_c0_g1_i3:106-2754(-)